MDVKNITIKLDDATAEWVRIHAASQGISVSRIVADMLCERMRADQRYAAAYRHFRERTARPLSSPGDTYPGRDSLHDRSGLR
jgi:hypothetical protein